VWPSRPDSDESQHPGAEAGGAGSAATVGRGVEGAPHGDRHRRIAGDQVDQGRADLIRVDGVDRVVVVLRRVLAHLDVGSAPRVPVR
jgi:hypothetical protein